MCERIWCKRSFPKNKKFEIENLKKKKNENVGRMLFEKCWKKLKDSFFLYFCFVVYVS